jgi:transcriptional regulator with XRE-family HTH domain
MLSVWKSVGDRLCEARKRLGLSRKAVAARAGLSENRVAEIEAGHSPITIDELILLEDVLRMRPGEFRRGIHWDQKQMTMVLRPAL